MPHVAPAQVLSTNPCNEQISTKNGHLLASSVDGTNNVREKLIFCFPNTTIQRCDNGLSNDIWYTFLSKKVNNMLKINVSAAKWLLRGAVYP